MKFRFLCLLTMIFMFFSLASCGEKSKELQLPEFQSEVTVEHSGNIYKGNLIFSSASDMEFTLSQPEEMKGMLFSCDGSVVTVKAGDVSLPAERLIKGNDAFTPLFDAVSLLASSQLKIKNSGTDNIILTKENEEIKIEFSSDDMRIISIQNQGNIYKFQHF